jgi:hypothetical protein
MEHDIEALSLLNNDGSSALPCHRYPRAVAGIDATV